MLPPPTGERMLTAYPTGSGQAMILLVCAREQATLRKSHAPAKGLVVRHSREFSHALVLRRLARVPPVLPRRSDTWTSHCRRLAAVSRPELRRRLPVEEAAAVALLAHEERSLVGGAGRRHWLAGGRRGAGVLHRDGRETHRRTAPCRV